MRHPSGTAHPFAKSVKGWGTRTRIKFPTSRKSGEKWGTRTGVKFPTSRKSGEKWGTRADQIPHFSQKRREMGHPSGSNSPLLAKAARNGAPSCTPPTLSQKARRMGHPPGSNSPLLAKAARNGAPSCTPPTLSQKARRMGHPPGSNSPLLAKAARNGAPLCLKFSTSRVPTSRKTGEKWGTQGEMGHPSPPHNLGNLGPSVLHANLNM